MTPSRFRAFGRPRARQSGFSLIEMMISVTIGLVIIGGLVGVLASTSSNSRSNDRTSELMTNGRYALNSVKQELREAGFRGYTLDKPMAPAALAGITNECLGVGAAAASFVSNLQLGIWGSNDTNPFSANCIPAASNYSTGDDVLVTRRVGVIPTAAADRVAAGLYLQSAYERGQVFKGTTPPDFSGSAPLATFALQTYVYYISLSSVGNTSLPSLRRVALRDSTFTDEEVVSGIEHMQVQYGVRTTTATNPNMQYFDTVAGGSSDTSTPDWDNVNSVRIWLLARNATPEPGYTNTSTYTMGNQTYTVNDSFRRQMFTTVVQLRN